MITDALRPNRSRTIVLACCAALVLAAGCEDRTNDTTTDDNRTNNGAGSGTSTPPSGGAGGTNTGAPGSTNPSGPGTSGHGNTPGTPGSPTNGQSSAVNPDARILSILNAKNQEEIEVGNLARQNGGSDAVKAYGEVLVRDHTANNTEVMRVAREGNFLLLPAEEVRRILAAARTGGANPAQPGGTPPSNPGPSTPPAGAVPPAGSANPPGAAGADPLAELRGLTGAQFDAAFVRMMHQGHAELIRIVEQAQNEVRDQRVKNLLANTLPVLRDHENRARAIAPGHDTPGNQTPTPSTPPSPAGGQSPNTPPAGGQNPGR